MSFRGFSSLSSGLGRASTSQRTAVHQARAVVTNRRVIVPSRNFIYPLLPRGPLARLLSTTATLRHDRDQPVTANTSSQSITSTTTTNSEPTTSRKTYSFEEIVNLIESPDKNRILIDVREPSELLETGRIPTSVNVPIQSSPDFAFAAGPEFEARFGFARPTEEQEVVFYCKAGVRSRAAAQLARRARFGGTVGEFPGSWVEWAARGGRVERESIGEGRRGEERGF